MTTTPTSSTQELRDSLEIFEIDSTTKFSWATLRMLLPDVETALFFAKVYDIDYSKLGTLLEITHDSTVPPC